MKGKKTVELFCGTKSFSKVFSDKKRAGSVSVMYCNNEV